MGTARSFYLFLYNATETVLWSIALYHTALSIATTGDLVGAYASAFEFIKLAQVVSFLEVPHALVGLVPSGPFQNLTQWLGRSHVLLLVLQATPEVHKDPAVAILFLSWSLAEVVRYPQYALSVINLCPGFLTWLRYTVFIILYPLGFFCEEWIMYKSLPFIKKRKLYDNIFKHLPFDYATFVLGVMSVAVLLWLQLYLHMFKQRRSKLGPQGKKKKTARDARQYRAKRAE